jgi:hypothetical protein
VVSYVVKKLPAFKEQECALPCSQEPVTRYCPEATSYSVSLRSVLVSATWSPKCSPSFCTQENRTRRAVRPSVSFSWTQSVLYSGYYKVRISRKLKAKWIDITQSQRRVCLEIPIVRHSTILYSKVGQKWVFRPCVQTRLGGKTRYKYY